MVLFNVRLLTKEPFTATTKIVERNECILESIRKPSLIKSMVSKQEGNVCLSVCLYPSLSLPSPPTKDHQPTTIKITVTDKPLS